MILMITPVWYLIHRTGIGGNICPVLDDAVQHLLGGEKGWITRRYYLLYVPIYGLMISYWKGKPHQMEKSLLAMALPLVLSFDWSVTDSELGSWGNFTFWTTALYLAFVFVMAVQLNIISLPKRKTVRITGVALVLAKGIYMLYDFAVVCHARCILSSCRLEHHVFVLLGETEAGIQCIVEKDCGGRSGFGIAVISCADDAGDQMDRNQ